MPPGINIANTESSREMSDVSPNQYERSLNETMLSNLLKEQSQEHVMVQNDSPVKAYNPEPKNETGHRYEIKPLATEPSSNDQLWQSMEMHSASVITGQGSKDDLMKKTDSEPEL